jgi:hypothetical protein
VHKAAHSSELTALRCTKEIMSCQMKPVPTVPMEVLTLELPQPEPTAI